MFDIETDQYGALIGFNGHAIPVLQPVLVSKDMSSTTTPLQIFSKTDNPSVWVIDHIVVPSNTNLETARVGFCLSDRSRDKAARIEGVSHDVACPIVGTTGLVSKQSRRMEIAARACLVAGAISPGS